MSEREPTLRDVLGAVSELRDEMGEVRNGLGDVRGRLDRLGGEVTELRGEVVEQGRRIDTLTGEVAEQDRRQDRVDDRLNTFTREVETLRTDLPAQVVAGVLVGFERSAYATDLRTLQTEVAELKADVAELKEEPRWREPPSVRRWPDAGIASAKPASVDHAPSGRAEWGTSPTTPRKAQQPSTCASGRWSSATSRPAA